MPSRRPLNTEPTSPNAEPVADPESFYYYHDIEGISGQYYIAPIG